MGNGNSAAVAEAHEEGADEGGDGAAKGNSSHRSFAIGTDQSGDQRVDEHDGQAIQNTGDDQIDDLVVLKYTGGKLAV